MSAAIINLSERLAAKAPKANPMPDIVLEDDLSRAIRILGCHLEVASLRARKAGDVEGGAHLWRVAISARQASERAERLERKYRKAKKKARR